MTFRHCGSEHPDMSLWNESENSKSGVGLKPFVGLWASPVGSEFSTWSSFTDYIEHPCKGAYFDFNIAPLSKVIAIRSVEALSHLIKKYGITEQVKGSQFEGPLNDVHPVRLNYENIKKDGYDAIYFEVSSDPENLHDAIYGLDVDSLVVLNPKCIVENTGE